VKGQWKFVEQIRRPFRTEGFWGVLTRHRVSGYYPVVPLARINTQSLPAMDDRGAR
jgi:hypothetical protein